MKSIFVPSSKNDLLRFLDDVNFNMTGIHKYLNDEEFITLWKSQTLNRYYTKTNILIDDYETTIIDKHPDLMTLKETLNNDLKLKRKNLKLVNEILALLEQAIVKQSGIIFFF